MTDISIEDDDNEIRVLAPSKPLVILNDTSKEAKEAYDAIKQFVQAMIKSEGKLDITNSMLLTKLVKEVVELANSYKQLKGNQKKKIIITLMKKVFNKELKSSNLDEGKKTLILLLIDNSIEPAIDIAIYVARGGIKIDKKTKKCLTNIFPCIPK